MIGRPEMRIAAAAAPPPRMALSRREMAAAVGVSERTAADWDARGVGPPSFVIGNRRLYPVASIAAWLRERVDSRETDREQRGGPCRGACGPKDV